jgi:hypothetical protein
MIVRRYAIGAAILGSFLLAPAARAALCNTPIRVGSVSTSGSTIQATLTNSTSSAVKAYYLFTTTLADGSTGGASMAVYVPANGSANVNGSFAVVIVGVPNSQACDKPGGITESPDPVIVIPPPVE